MKIDTWPPSGLVNVLIKSCCCNNSETWFGGVVLAFAGNLEHLIVFHWSFSTNWLVNFRQILEYLSESVPICTDLYRFTGSAQDERL